MKRGTSSRRGQDTSTTERIVVPLYTIVDRRYEGHNFPVVLWVGYGPVAPTLWTTNGSIWCVARLTSDYVRSGYFEIQDSRIEADFSDARSIRDAIQRLCETDHPVAQEEPTP